MRLDSKQKVILFNFRNNMMFNIIFVHSFIQNIDPQLQAFCTFAVRELNTKLKEIANKHNAQMIDLFSLFTDYGIPLILVLQISI